MQRLIQKEDERKKHQNIKRMLNLYGTEFGKQTNKRGKKQKKKHIHTLGKHISKKKSNAFVFHYSFLFADSYASIKNVIVFCLCHCFGVGISV